jgi:hypothetical protein
MFTHHRGAEHTEIKLIFRLPGISKRKSSALSGIENTIFYNVVYLMYLLLPRRAGFFLPIVACPPLRAAQTRRAGLPMGKKRKTLCVLGASVVKYNVK